MHAQIGNAVSRNERFFEQPRQCRRIRSNFEYPLVALLCITHLITKDARLITLLPHSVWRNFILGFLGNIFTFFYVMRISWNRRHSGFLSGAFCGTTMVVLGVVWIVMYVCHLWKTILFDFPFPVTYSFYTIYMQSTYFTFTTVSYAFVSADSLLSGRYAPWYLCTTCVIS